MLGLMFVQCDENADKSVADVYCKNKADDNNLTDWTAKRRKSEPVCQTLEKHPLDHDLEIVSMPPPLHRKGVKPTSQQRRASAPAPQVIHRPQRTHIQITIPDITDDHSREHGESAATDSNTREHSAQRAAVESPDRRQERKSIDTVTDKGKRTATEKTNKEQDRSCSPQQRRSSDIDTDRAKRAAVENTGREQNRSCSPELRRTSLGTARGSSDSHEQRVGTISSKPVKLIQKKESTNEGRNSCLPTGNKTRTAVKTARADNDNDEQSSRTGKVRVVSITATVRRQSKNENNRKGTERPTTPKVTPRRQSVPQRRMSTVTGSKLGVRRKSVPANIHNRTTRGKQKTKKVEKDLENDQNQDCDQVVSSRHIASDSSAMDQQFSTISIKCPSSENITIMQDLQNSQSLNSSSCGLFQVELNRAFTYSYFQFLPPHFPK